MMNLTLPQMIQNRIWVLVIAAAVDLLIGDPHWLWHPVQGVGALISWLEKILRALFGVPVLAKAEDAGRKQEAPGTGSASGVQDAASTPDRHDKKDTCSAESTTTARMDDVRKIRERTAGGLMVLLVLAVSTGVVVLILQICSKVHPCLRLLAEGILCGRLLALRSLGEAGFAVRDPLRKGDIEGARHAVSMIVGRDTDRLDAEGIAKAAVETVAENTSDGVTAPLFYMILLGGAGGIFYKAVNTMDSMTGYKNDRYRYFGTAAARLDDVMNYIPSRLTALCMILTCFLPGKETVQTLQQGMGGGAAAEGRAGPIRIPDGAAAFRIWRRDRRQSPSPNSAQTESVCAGALHLCLLGDTWYFGEVHHKAEIGDGGRPVEPEDITRAVRLMNRTTVLMFAAGILALAAAGLLL